MKKRIAGPHGRKLKKTTSPGNPVIDLINYAIDQMPGRSLKEVAMAIKYPYGNLWNVYRGFRNLPIIPLSNLCRFLNISDTQALELFQEQPPPIRRKTRAEQEVEAAASGMATSISAAPNVNER